MGKKILYVVLMVLGGFMLLNMIRIIPDVLEVASSEKDIPFKIGYFTTLILFIALGIFLIRFGYRKLNPSKPKKKDTIDDIGQTKN